MHATEVQSDAAALLSKPEKRPWYRCVEFWLLIAIVLAIHFSRLTDMMLHGEETRRATVAMEMLRTGDWIVPDLQGDVFYFSNRPPLQQWLIAGLGTLRGEVDTLAVRLPSALAILATSVLVWWYCGAFLSRLGAFAAAVAFASMGQVIELGSRGESDALFTFFVAASMLTWHRGFALERPALRVWCVTYFCVALAMLTKGVQAPVYFSASVAAFLVVTRQWRYALSWHHAVGIGVFLLILGAWQIPFFLSTSFDAVRYIYFGDVARYGNDNQLLAIAEHMATYPIKLLFCLLPWSILIASFIGRDIRRATIVVRQPIVFVACAAIITFPSVWLIEGAESRFFMSLYPCFAVMVGVVVQLSIEAAPGDAVRTIWRNFAMIFTAAVPLTALFIAIVSFLDTPLRAIHQPALFAVAFLAFGALAGVLLWRTRHARTLQQGVIGITCVAAYVGLLITGVAINVDQRNATDKVAQVARARQAIPAGEMLYSLGPVDHGFAYFYRDAIGITPWPEEGEALPAEVEYFVFQAYAPEADDAFAFAWEPIAFVNSLATKSDDASRMVIVARKLTGASDGRETSDVLRERYLQMQAMAGRLEHSIPQ